MIGQQEKSQTKINLRHCPCSRFGFVHRKGKRWEGGEKEGKKKERGGEEYHSVEKEERKTFDIKFNIMAMRKILFS